MAQEKQALKLTAEIDNLRKDARHKDAQLSNMANKVQLSLLLALCCNVFKNIIVLNVASSLIAVKAERA